MGQVQCDRPADFRGSTFNDCSVTVIYYRRVIITDVLLVAACEGLSSRRTNVTRESQCLPTDGLVEPHMKGVGCVDVLDQSESTLYYHR